MAIHGSCKVVNGCHQLVVTLSPIGCHCFLLRRCWRSLASLLASVAAAGGDVAIAGDAGLVVKTGDRWRSLATQWLSGRLLLTIVIDASSQKEVLNSSRVDCQNGCFDIYIYIYIYRIYYIYFCRYVYIYIYIYIYSVGIL